MRLAKSVADLRSSGLDVGRVGNLWYGGGLSNAKVQVARAAGFDVIDGYVPRASTCGLGAPYFPSISAPAITAGRIRRPHGGHGLRV